MRDSTKSNGWVVKSVMAALLTMIVTGIGAWLTLGYQAASKADVISEIHKQAAGKIEFIALQTRYNTHESDSKEAFSKISDTLNELDDTMDDLHVQQRVIITQLDNQKTQQQSFQREMKEMVTKLSQP